MCANPVSIPYKQPRYAPTYEQQPITENWCKSLQVKVTLPTSNTDLFNKNPRLHDKIIGNPFEKIVENQYTKVPTPIEIKNQINSEQEFDCFSNVRDIRIRESFVLNDYIQTVRQPTDEHVDRAPKPDGD